MTTVDKVKTFLTQALDKFNALDYDMDDEPNSIHKYLWGPAAALVLIGLFNIFYQIWWLPFLIVLLVVGWNGIAMLSFQKPPLIMPPKMHMNTLYQAFHNIAKSKRILFLTIPFFILAYAVRGFQASFLAWMISLLLLGVLRYLLTFDKWLYRKYSDKDYLALGVASVIGFFCFFGVHPAEIPDTEKPKTPEQIAKEKEQKKKEQLEVLKTNQTSYADRIVALEATNKKMNENWQKRLDALQKITKELKKENIDLKARALALEKESNQAKTNLAAVEKRTVTLEKSPVIKNLQKSIDDRLFTLKKESDTLRANFRKQIQEQLAVLQNKNIDTVQIEKLIEEHLSKWQGNSDKLGDEKQKILTRLTVVEEKIQSNENSLSSYVTLGTRVSKLEEETSTMRLMETHVRIGALESDMKAMQNLKDQMQLLALQNNGNSSGDWKKSYDTLKNAFDSMQLRLTTLENQNKTLKLMESTQARIFALEQENRDLKERDKKTLVQLREKFDKMAEDFSDMEEESKMFKLLQQVQLNTQIKIGDFEAQIKEINRKLEDLERKIND